MKLHIHHLAQAQLDGVAVGTIVLKPKSLVQMIEDVVPAMGMPDNGQGFFFLPPEACAMTTAGVARRTQSPEDYVPRLHRGAVGTYLRRDRVSEVDLVPDKVAVVVYTTAAYAIDPQVDPADVAAAIMSGATHVLVTVLGIKGPKAPVTPDRFAANLAGGNNAALTATADAIRAEARDVQAYYSTWCVVG